MLPLTDRQRETKAWIDSYVKSNSGRAPTLQEIADGLGCNAANARYLVNQLRKRGHLTFAHRLWRTVQLIPEAARPTI